MSWRVSCCTKTGSLWVCVCAGAGGGEGGGRSAALPAPAVRPKALPPHACVSTRTGANHGGALGPHHSTATVTCFETRLRRALALQHLYGPVHVAACFPCSMGNRGVIRPGMVQRMSAGSGVTHSERNPSKGPTHFLQIWFLPNVRDVAPGYQEAVFDAASKRGALRLVASPDGADGSVSIHANARMYAGTFDHADKVCECVSAREIVFARVFAWARGALRWDGPPWVAFTPAVWHAPLVWRAGRVTAAGALPEGVRAPDPGQAHSQRREPRCVCSSPPLHCFPAARNGVWGSGVHGMRGVRSQTAGTH
jgi:hypothetical protein